MKKNLSKSLLIGFTILLTMGILILSGCIVEVKGETFVYGEGLVANIDCFQGSSKPHRVLFNNKSDGNLIVKYAITETNDSTGYDETAEPTWSSVSTSITVNVDSTADIQTNLGSSSNNYAVVWMRVQNQANTKYLIFSVFLSKADNMEYDVTIKQGN